MTSKKNRFRILLVRLSLKRREFWLEIKRGKRARVQTEMVEFITLPFLFSSKRRSLAGTAKKCTKKRDARAELLFCSLNLLLLWRSPCRRRRSFLATGREHQLATRKRAERTKHDFRCLICRSAIGQQLFDLRAPLSTDVPVLLLNQPTIEDLTEIRNRAWKVFGTQGGPVSKFEVRWKKPCLNRKEFWPSFIYVKPLGNNL